MEKLENYIYGDTAEFPYLGVPQGYWEDADGNLIDFSDMSEEYVERCLKMLERYQQSRLTYIKDIDVREKIFNLLEQKKTELNSFIQETETE